jgi:hypothetical protein
MDLLKELSRTINFTYHVALSPDGQFGNYIIKNASANGAKKEWTGLIGKIIPNIWRDVGCNIPNTSFDSCHIFYLKIQFQANS